MAQNYDSKYNWKLWLKIMSQNYDLKQSLKIIIKNYESTFLNHILE